MYRLVLAAAVPLVLAAGCASHVKPSAVAAPPTTSTSTSTTSTTAAAITIPTNFTQLPPHPVGTTRRFTTTTVAAPPCTPPDVAVTGSTDKSNYQRGEVVHVTGTVRNVGVRTCYLPSSFTVDIRDGSGNGIGGYGVSVDVAGGTLPPPSWTPTYNWPETTPEGKPVPLGHYSIKVSFSDFGKVYGSKTLDIEIAGYAGGR
jgi:hypothetical protein